MKRFFVTVTAQDSAPIGFSNVAIDCETVEDAKRIAIETVSEQTGNQFEYFKATVAKILKVTK